MLKEEFRAVFDDEIEFYSKRFLGDDDRERELARRRFLQRYYESLSHATLQGLKGAFKQCREQYEYFPKINQLLRFIPKPMEQPKFEESIYSDPSPEVAQAIQRAKEGKGQRKVGEKQLRRNAALCVQRWPNSDWDKPLERWLKEDKERL